MTLPLALQSAFPQYPTTAHKKAGERMEKDMKYGVRGPILGTRPKPDFTTEGENARLAKTITILMDTNADLLAALEELNSVCELSDDEYYSKIDGAMRTARAAIAKARKGGGE